MSFRHSVLALFLFSSGILCAASHKIVIARPTTVGATQLAPGSYTMEVEGEKALFKNGKNVVAEAAITVEDAPVKYQATQVISTPDAKLKSVAIKGTGTKYVIAN